MRERERERERDRGRKGGRERTVRPLHSYAPLVSHCVRVPPPCRRSSYEKRINYYTPRVKKKKREEKPSEMEKTTQLSFSVSTFISPFGIFPSVRPSVVANSAVVGVPI